MADRTWARALTWRDLAKPRLQEVLGFAGFSAEYCRSASEDTCSKLGVNTAMNTTSASPLPFGANAAMHIEDFQLGSPALAGQSTWMRWFG